MHFETGQLKISLALARQHIGGFKDEYAYGLIKEIWAPKKQ